MNEIDPGRSSGFKLRRKIYLDPKSETMAKVDPDRGSGVRVGVEGCPMLRFKVVAVRCSRVCRGVVFEGL